MSIIFKLKNAKDSKELKDTLTQLEVSITMLNKTLNETVGLVNNLYQFVNSYYDTETPVIKSLELRRIKAGKGLPPIMGGK